jgi:RsiW-degrading membrane proteinase PrsW (M82 family)
MLPSLMLIIAVTLLYLLLIRALDQHTQTGGLCLSLLWGGASFALAYLVQNSLVNSQLLNITGARLFSAPVLEELLKALPLLLLVSRSRAVYGFAIGLGFALVESGVCISANPDYALGTALARVISIHLIHGFTTALVGLIASRKVPPKGFAAAVLIAMLVHAGFNLLAVSLEGKALVLAAAYAGVSSAALLILLMSRRAHLLPAELTAAD